MKPYFAAGTALLAAPALLVAAWGLAPSAAAVLLAAAAAAPLYHWLRRLERSLPDERLPRWHVLLWAVLLMAATVQFSRVAIFVVNPRKPVYAALPNADKWALYHVCFTGYTEAARVAAEGGANIYDPASYREPGEEYATVAGLPVDEFEYPPPFLSLPAALSAVTAGDFHRTRALFYGLQGLVVLLVMVATVFRLPPSSRSVAWSLIPGVIAAFQTMVGMQYGNFQSGAFALAMAGMLAATRSTAAPGTAALAFAAVSKLFPVLVVALLVGARRYSAAAVTLAWMSGLVLLSLLLFGTRPYADFVWYQLPAIASGSGLPGRSFRC